MNKKIWEKIASMEMFSNYGLAKFNMVWIFPVSLDLPDIFNSMDTIIMPKLKSILLPTQGPCNFHIIDSQFFPNLQLRPVIALWSPREEPRKCMI